MNSGTSSFRLVLWGQLVAASAVLTGLGFIVMCMIWPEDVPRDEYFVDGLLLVVGGTIIQLLCRIVDLMEISRIRTELEELKKKRQA